MFQRFQDVLQCHDLPQVTQIALLMQEVMEQALVTLYPWWGVHSHRIHTLIVAGYLLLDEYTWEESALPWYFLSHQDECRTADYPHRPWELKRLRVLSMQLFYD